jgi:hypothetical protein
MNFELYRQANTKVDAKVRASHEWDPKSLEANNTSRDKTIIATLKRFLDNDKLKPSKTLLIEVGELYVDKKNLVGTDLNHSIGIELINMVKHVIETSGNGHGFDPSTNNHFIELSKSFANLYTDLENPQEKSKLIYKFLTHIITFVPISLINYNVQVELGWDSLVDSKVVFWTSMSPKNIDPSTKHTQNSMGLIFHGFMKLRNLLGIKLLNRHGITDIMELGKNIMTQVYFRGSSLAFRPSIFTPKDSRILFDLALNVVKVAETKLLYPEQEYHLTAESPNGSSEVLLGAIPVDSLLSLLTNLPLYMLIRHPSRRNLSNYVRVNGKVSEA